MLEPQLAPYNNPTWFPPVFHLLLQMLQVLNSRFAIGIEFKF